MPERRRHATLYTRCHAAIFSLPIRWAPMRAMLRLPPYAWCCYTRALTRAMPAHCLIVYYVTLDAMPLSHYCLFFDWCHFTSTLFAIIKVIPRHFDYRLMPRVWCRASHAAVDAADYFDAAFHLRFFFSFIELRYDIFDSLPPPLSMLITPPLFRRHADFSWFLSPSCRHAIDASISCPFMLLIISHAAADAYFDYFHAMLMPWCHIALITPPLLIISLLFHYAAFFFAIDFCLSDALSSLLAFRFDFRHAADFLSLYLFRQ